MAGGGMSHPARAPRSGIDGKTNAAQGRCGEGGINKNVSEAERMSADTLFTSYLSFELADTVGITTTVRPGKGRSRVKTQTDEKIKKPADGVRKKSPPARKAPTRGRYVDEYARPTI